MNPNPKSKSLLKHKGLFLLFITLQVLDILTTCISMSKGGSELNPFMGMLLDHSIYTFIFTKFIVAFISGYLIFMLNLKFHTEFRKKVFEYIRGFSMYSILLVVFWNCMVILML